MSRRRRRQPLGLEWSSRAASRERDEVAGGVLKEGDKREEGTETSQTSEE